jgi:DNA-binding transcriptional LysR family regulator
MVTLRQLEVFQTVVRIGSVTAAADALYVSQPTVSDTLRALEHELGEPLFTGSRRARQLTRAGEVYKRFVDRALAAVDDGSRAVGDLGETVGGQLSLLAVTTAGEHLMPPVIHEFLTRYPEVEVTLMVANRAGARTPIAESVIDLAIMGRPPVGVSVESLRIGPNRLMLVAAPHHVLAPAERGRLG